MSNPQPLPDWQLPSGVCRGLWEYTHSEHIAYDFDDAFATSELLEYDEHVLLKHFTEPGTLVDLGCGTGRLLIPFARRGFRCLGVDLSPHMLAVAGSKARREQLQIDRVMANIVELDALSDQVADYAICMFATLGMIQGREHRLKAVRHAWRILKPGGKLALHVHNRWYNLWVPGGWKWLVRNAFQGLLGRTSAWGDKFYDFRGVRQLHMHVFTAHELKRLMADAGFKLVELQPLDTARRHALRAPWWFGRLRANGWLLIAEKE